MLKHFFTILLTLSYTMLNASYMQEFSWKKGESFLTFLESQNIPNSIYYDLDREDRELAAEIMSGRKFQILRGDDESIEQVLIPVGEELQLHLIKDKKTQKYSMQITPISYQTEHLSVTVSIEHSPYQDIVNATNNTPLANEFINAYKKSLNFRNLKKGDRLVIFYTQRKKLGKRFGQPTIDAGMIETRGEPNFVFLYDDNRYYNDKGKEIEGYLLRMPLNHYRRISSPFTHKRWHPVLKRYRAHLGIDYSAKSGTPVKASGNGTIIWVGRKGGYGKTVQIRHSDGYKTLYAHLKGYKKGLRSGQKVSKGKTIAYVGNTGISTGPHLHFGLYKHNRAINPNKVVKITKSVLKGDEKKRFTKLVDDYKNRFELALKEKKTPVKELDFQYVVPLKK